MGLFKDEMILVFNDPDLSFDIEVTKKTGKAEFDQDSSSPTFGKLITPQEEKVIRRVSIQPYSTNDEQDGMVARYLSRGYQINNLAYMASLEEINIGDTLLFLGFTYEVMESVPVVAGNSGTYQIIYYDCLIAKKEH